MSAWSGVAYDSVAVPQARWGEDVLARLSVGPACRVLDAGCGPGQVTELLLRRHPDVTVVALDATESMLDQARLRLAPFAERVQFVLGDLEGNHLADALGGQPVDAVFSTGTFHWVLDHRRLFRQLATVLNPGGTLVAQCGGAGSLAAVRAILDDLGVDWRSHNSYADADETAHHLRAAGFRDVWTWLAPAPVEFADRTALADFLAAGALTPYLANRPSSDQRALCEAVAEQLDAPILDFVRLNILARGPTAER
ncbi:MAG: class I SAM-dependent methyltransferase [Acidimicrobiales bacterium]